MSESYIAKLQHIKETLERRSAAAAVGAPDKVETQYNVLIRTLEDIAETLTSKHVWLDLPSEGYQPKSVRAPPASDPVDRMAWATQILSLQINAFQDLLRQNLQVSTILDSIPISPIVQLTPVTQTQNLIAPRRKESKEALQVEASVASIGRKERVRKISGTGTETGRQAGAGRRPSTPQLSAALVDDEKVTPRGPSLSPQDKIARAITKKVSNLDLTTTASADEAAHVLQDTSTIPNQPRQFYRNPPLAHQRSVSHNVDLNSFFGKGRVESSPDPSNRV